MPISLTSIPGVSAPMSEPVPTRRGIRPGSSQCEPLAVYWRTTDDGGHPGHVSGECQDIEVFAHFSFEVLVRGCLGALHENRCFSPSPHSTRGVVPHGVCI
jgi:hypothetical protein